MKTLSLIAILLSLSACSSPVPPDRSALSATWCLDMTEEQATAFEDAMREWNERTGVTSWRRDETSCSMRAWPVPDGDPILEGHSAGACRAGVCAEGLGIPFSEGLSQDILGRIFLHELGHIAWLDHSGDPSDIMYPKITGVRHLSEHDLAEFNRVNW